MRKFAQRLAVLVTSTAVVVGISAAPAQAATNPYTGPSACANDFGGSWTVVTDGHRAIKKGTATIGDVYLTYNSATGENCVATIKRIYVGTETLVGANLFIYAVAGYWHDQGNYKYYAAVKYKAAGRCVKYEGYVRSGSVDYWGIRDYYENCGS
ncbi:hypothetical protein [Micromonospora sp. SL4-19]|uniref:hypothetical protein n=1 Tax=Micromonospora sp. SL4-19 TaxID=3399129 RepID=UPI003A4DCCA8